MVHSDGSLVRRLIDPIVQHVIRIAHFVASLMVGSWSYAQADGSLTKEFEGLTAKERSRIAKKEEGESENDQAYQAVMVLAEQRFRAKQFELALEKYKEARNMRPFNVFPKVKIEDLNALIAKQAEEQQQPVDPGGTIEKADPQMIKPPSEERGLVVNDAPTEEKVRSDVRTSETSQKQNTKHPVIRSNSGKRSDRQLQPVSSGSPDGVTEQYTKEGRAVVCERTLTIDGRSSVYRRVIHPWGDITYFKDGISIPEHSWIEAFSE